MLLKRGSEISGDPGVWDVAEMFVVRGRRRRGTGSDAIQQVWRRLPGRWEVRVMEANRAALPFWERTIARFCGAPAPRAVVEKNGKRWTVLSFGAP